MTKPAAKVKRTTPTRVNIDIAQTAAAVAPTEHRSTVEQINYWARLGMEIDRATTVATRTVRAVAAGDHQFSELTSDERAAAHALIDAGIRERASMARFGPDARGVGKTTVVLDDGGELVEISPDGTRRRL